MTPWTLQAIVLWSALIASCHADVEPQAIALNCMNCHPQGSGEADGEIPPLQQLSARQLQQALLDFKYDRKESTLMARIAKGYSDQELAAVAAYLSQK